MHNATPYLNDYINVLNRPFAAGTADQVIADWSWAHRGRVAGTVDDLNQAMGLAEEAAFRDHIPTFSVGALDGLIYVSANPGFKAAQNALEHAHRSAGSAINLNFCRHFFDVFPAAVGANSWWTRALGFAFLLQMQMGARQQTAARWAWAAQRQPLPNGGLASVGNVDLIPLHSTAYRVGLNQANPASQLLHSVALTTLRTVLSIEPAPRLILVASSDGAALVELEAQALGLQPVVRHDAAPYAQFLRQYQHANGRTLVTFGRQVFAGNFAMNRPAGFDWNDFADLLRPLAAPPY